jgi:hypothetical protein
MDLEIANDHCMTDQKKILDLLCQDMGIPFTIFTTSNAAKQFSEQLMKLYNLKHSIGCHGVDHDYAENYKTLSEQIIINNIRIATDCITAITNEKPTCFRGPRMTTSAKTQNVLVNAGYRADFSVCPQRFDILNSQGGCGAWLFAPRKPYNPSNESPFKKGNSPLLVVPLSCVGFPFISGVLYLFGLTFMKLLFKLLYFEALIRGTAIVYLFHSYEFCKKDQETVPSKTKKLPIHQRLYISDPLKRYELHVKLLKYIKSHKSVTFKTAKDMYNVEQG